MSEARRANAANPVETDTAAFRHIPGQMASLPRVVGASSAFPGFFPPVEISAADLGVREGQFPTGCFTDGGVYDNLGTRAFAWLMRLNREFDQILVSDAGKPFQVLNDASLGMIGQSMRATDILWDRVSQLERESFGRQEGFVFLPIAQVVDPSDDPTAQHPVVQAEVQSIRTDLDRFFPVEINSLVQHDYEVARNVCRREGTLGDAQLPDAPPWLPLPDGHSTTGHPGIARPRQPAAPTLLSRQLRKSSRRRVPPPSVCACDTRSSFHGIIVSPVSQVKVIPGFFVPGPQLGLVAETRAPPRSGGRRRSKEPQTRFEHLPAHSALSSAHN